MPSILQSWAAEELRGPATPPHTKLTLPTPPASARETLTRAIGTIEETEDMNDTDLENEIAAKGLDAPRLTPTLIDETIAGEDYHVFPGSQLTVCCLTLRNGYTVTGESACASPENFDAEIGKKIARDNARAKIWGLEGYLLKQRLHEGG